MYDAAVRATYADLFKTAEAGLGNRVGEAIREAIKSHPALAMTISAALAGTGGYALADQQAGEKHKSQLQGIAMGHQLARG
jgi:hypothetical protein